MNDPMLVHIVHSATDLPKNEPGVALGQVVTVVSVVFNKCRAVDEL